MPARVRVQRGVDIAAADAPIDPEPVARELVDQVQLGARKRGVDTLVRRATPVVIGAAEARAANGETLSDV